MNQEHHISALEVLQYDWCFSTLHFARASLAWATQSRCELAWVANKSAQVTEAKFQQKDISDFNRVVGKTNDALRIGLEYKHIDNQYLHSRVYSSVSFALNENMPSQLEYLVLLGIDTGICPVLNFSSKKVKRVVWSIIAAALYGFIEASDSSMTLATDLSQYLGRMLPICMFIHS